MIYPLALLSVSTVLISTIICRPEWISDKNEFLKNFVNHEYLSTMGFILAITLASLAQVHISLSKMSERGQAIISESTFSEIKSSASWLIMVFSFAVVLVVIKPILPLEETFRSVVNAVALFLLTLYILILHDITISVLEIRIKQE